MKKLSIFEHVIATKPKRSTFNLSHMNSLTMEMGKLVPIMCEEVVPGDTWKIKTDLFIRFAPLYAPVMHRINATIHWYYVPMRLVWEDYRDFITGGPLGNLKPAFPVIELADGRVGSDYYDSLGLMAPGSLADYLNYPTTESHTLAGGMHVNALPLRAYQLIYNEYYRDENLIEEIPISLESGTIAFGSDEWRRLLTIRRRAWRKDYFTSALPWTQRGGQQSVPIFGNGEVADSQHPTFVGTQGPDMPNPGQFQASYIRYPGASRQPMVEGDHMYGQGSDIYPVGTESGQGEGTLVAVDNARNLDLSGVDVNLTGGKFLINDLRRANRIQQWLERQARVGSRYKESEEGHFGVISDDARIQRPEFLGGGVQPVQVSDVLQTSETTETSPQASPAGIAFASGSKNGFKRSFKERGYIIGILSVCPVPAYSEGVPRAYRKFDKFDFYWPEFASLGEQPIYNFELALRGNDHLGTFGYAPRYAEYKHIPDRVHSQFKTSLKFWNLARHFTEQPTLSGEFVTINAQTQDLNRIFNVEAEGTEELDHLWVQVHNAVMARRPMPYLPDPSL